MELQSQNLNLFYPYQILQEFEKKAASHIENGVKKKLMACVIGYKDESKLIGEELLFPKQSSPYSNITETNEDLLGKQLVSTKLELKVEILLLIFVSKRR